MSNNLIQKIFNYCNNTNLNYNQFDLINKEIQNNLLNNKKDYINNWDIINCLNFKYFLGNTFIFQCLFFKHKTKLNNYACSLTTQLPKLFDRTNYINNIRLGKIKVMIPFFIIHNHNYKKINNTNNDYNYIEGYSCLSCKTIGFAPTFKEKNFVIPTNFCNLSLTCQDMIVKDLIA